MHDIYLTYLLMSLTGIVLLAAIAAGFRSRIWALSLLAVAMIIGIGTAIVASVSLGGPISSRAYAQVRIASQRDPGTDAAAQWALGDNVITPDEYGQIAALYKDKTGDDMRRINPDASTKEKTP